MKAISCYSLDEILSAKKKAGESAMPVLLHYFDDELFDIYAGLFNAQSVKASLDDQRELELAQFLLTQVDRKKFSRKLLSYTINRLLQ